MRIQLFIYGLVKTGGIDKTQNISSDEYKDYHHIVVYYGFVNAISVALYHLGPLLLTWFNFNPSMDK